jgi:O-antigen/teichoic acid export membrane protein
MRRINWPLWAGSLLTIVAFVSYPFFFARFPVTRDVPWASFLVFAIALMLVIDGFRRAERKVVASIVVTLSTAVLVLFTVAFLFFARLPASPGAPAVGQTAPDFTMLDTTRHPVTLAGLRAAPNRKGTVLVFYRGYW